MKMNLLFIAIFALLIALEMNYSDAVYVRYRLDKHKNIHSAKKHQQLNSKSLSLSTSASTTMAFRSFLSENEMKSIEAASAKAFNQLKRFYVVAARSRFG